MIMEIWSETFLIVRDNAHQNAFAKALETLGVEWGKIFPIPNDDIHKYPECQKYVDMGFHKIHFFLYSLRSFYLTSIECGVLKNEGG